MQNSATQAKPENAIQVILTLFGCIIAMIFWLYLVVGLDLQLSCALGLISGLNLTMALGSGKEWGKRIFLTFLIASLVILILRFRFHLF